MAEIEVEGRTVEDAIRDGLKQLGCPREKVDIKILNEGSTGLFGLMGAKPARVLLTTKDGAAHAANPNVDYAAAQKQVKETLGTMLKLMNIDYSEIKTSLLAGRVMVDIKTPEGSIVIGKGGQTLDALEHVLNLIINKEDSTRVKVDIDTEEYRRRQEDRLQTLAQKAAATVRRTNKIYRFDPMSSKERRILHMALKAEPDLESFSEGEGAYRKVGVKLKKR